jgi:hypothetical protein
MDFKEKWNFNKQADEVKNKKKLSNIGKRSTCRADVLDFEEVFLEMSNIHSAN